jgi:hypothetical protein
MTWLLLVEPEGGKFDPVPIETWMRTGGSKRGFRRESVAGYACEFQHEGDIVTVTFPDRQTDIGLEGAGGPASLEAVLQIRRVYGRNLLLIDECYNFSVIVGAED